MAYPANLAPGTPSAKYGIIAVSTALFIEMRGNFYLYVSGAVSRCFIDIPYYDSSTGRDAVDSSFLGRSPMNIIQSASALSPVVTNINGDVLIGDPGDLTANPDEMTIMIQQDDNFTHTPPHQLVKCKTMIQWYDAATATGNLVAECDFSRYVGSSVAIPQTNGSVPPTYSS